MGADAGGRVADQPAAFEPVSRAFQKGLQRLKVDWPVSTEASSLDMITWYVANGHGIGLSVQVAPMGRGAKVRILPLEGFDPLVIAALGIGQAMPRIRAVLAEGRRYVREAWPQWQCEDPLPS